MIPVKKRKEKEELGLSLPPPSLPLFLLNGLLIWEDHLREREERKVDNCLRTEGRKRLTASKERRRHFCYFFRFTCDDEGGVVAPDLAVLVGGCAVVDAGVVVLAALDGAEEEERAGGQQHAVGLPNTKVNKGVWKRVVCVSPWGPRRP